MLELEEIPKSAVVLGGGYTACELGQFLSRMGARTTMLIRSGHLLTQSDDDVGDALTGYFRDEGIEVEMHATLVERAAPRREKVVRYIADGEEREAVGDEIFYALGRVPNVGGSASSRPGIAYGARSGIAVDATLRTTNPNVYAVGDVTGEYMLVHVAIYQGEVAARNACMNAGEPADYDLVGAHTVFSRSASRRGRHEREGRCGARASRTSAADTISPSTARRSVLAKTKGFVKMMADSRSGRILGAARDRAASVGADPRGDRRDELWGDGRPVHAHPAPASRRSRRSGPIPPKPARRSWA